MGKGEAGFNGVKIFNERSTEVYVQVQMVSQPGGVAVLNGASERIQVPASATRDVLNSGVALHMPRTSWMRVDVYNSAATDATKLATFGPVGVQCKYDNAAREIDNVEVRITTDVTATPEYCRLVARMYFRPVPAETPTKSVTALMQSFLFVNAAQTASKITTPDGALRVGVDAEWPAPNSVQQALPPALPEPPALPSPGLHQKWTVKVVNEPPARFHLLSAIAADGPAIAAMTDGTAEATTESLPTPHHHLLLVQCFHADGDGAVEVEDGWQIVSAENGDLLSSTSVEAQTLKFLPPNDPNAVNQLWSIGAA